MKKCIYLVLYILASLHCLESFGQPCEEIRRPNHFCRSGETKLETYQQQNWDWELPFQHNLYDEAWTAFVPKCGNILMGSPFYNPDSPKLRSIVNDNDKDYTKDKGWVLIARNFGCAEDRPFPYFILYNKYSGLLRCFVYINNDGTQFLTGVAFVFNSESVASPVTTGSQTILKAPDVYRDQSVEVKNEIAVYVSDAASVNSWAVGELQTVFDPYYAHEKYGGKNLQIRVLGIERQGSTVTLDGTSLIDGFSFSGTTTDITPVSNSDKPLSKISAVGKSIMEFSSGMSDFKNKIHTGAEALNEYKDRSGVIKDLFNKVDGFLQEKTAFSFAVTSVASLTGVGAPILKMVGAITGLFSSSSVRASVPASGQAQGAITAFDLANISFQLPGSSHNGAENKPYYNCPLGVINIANTPVLDYCTSQRRVFEVNKWVSGGVVWEDEYDPYTVYKSNFNIEAFLNNSAGLELVSAKAALVAEVNSADLFKPHNSPYFVNRNAAGYINHMLADLESGITEINYVDPKKKIHRVQTPWVDISCFNKASFSVYTACKVYVVFRAILRKPGAGDKDPIIVQNYYVPRIEFNKTLVHDNKGPRNGVLNIPPFGTRAMVSMQSDLELKSSPKSDYSANYRLFTNGKISIPSNANRAFKSSGGIDLATSDIENNSVGDQNNYFEVPLGAIFEAYIENRRPDLSCSEPINIQQIAGDCGFDNSAHRVGDVESPSDAQAADAMTIFPNPTKDKLTLKLNIENSESLSVSIFNTLGNKVFDVDQGLLKNGTLELDLSDQPAGIYWVKMVSNNEIFTQKVMLNK